MTIPTSLLAASCNPPSITALDASGSGALPPWVLLETRVYFAHRDDSTAASAKTSRDEHEIVVSIRFADPPALSHVCLHCPTLSTTNFVGEPHVVRSHQQFLLLHLPLTWPTSGIPKRSDEYYMYQVTLTHGKKKPRLSRIPDPKPCLLLPTDLGIYCPADSPGEYILAGLCPTRNAEAHELHLYSSKTNAWTMKRARLANPKWEEEHLPVRPHKVIPLGGSLLGWVDLWKGVLVCDVLSSYRVAFLRFVPFPATLPGNTTCHLCPWKVRDFVACTNGALKFVEIEHFPEPFSESVAAEDPPDIVYDDPPPSAEPNDDRDTEPPSLFGWRCIIWNRVLSDNCWRKGCDVRSHDMLVHNASPSALLAAGLWDDTAGNSKTIDLLPTFPNLSIHGDDVVHLKSLLRLDVHDVPKRHMISIDMTSTALKTLVPCAAAARLDAYCPHFTCALSSHLSNTPDLAEAVQASNSENVNAAPPQIIQASHSQNVTDNECPRSCAHDVIGAPPSQDQNGGSNIDFSLSFGLCYNRSHRAYADDTRPIYGNNQWSWPSQQQPTYQPNYSPRPSSFSPGSVNLHPAYPVFNAAAFGPMTHPPPFVLPTAFSTQLPSVLPPVAGHSLGRSGHRMPRGHPPYEPSWQIVYPYY